MCRNYGCNRIKPSPFLTIESVSREQTLMDATAGFGRIKRSIIGEVEDRWHRVGDCSASL